MNRAQEQLGEEEETVFTETNRDAFIALATGNTHAHPDYVLLRQLESFPLPLHLRKDPRGAYISETRQALPFQHADPGADQAPAEEVERARTLMSPSAERRKRLHDIVHAQRQDLVERFSANGSRVDSDGTPLVVSPEARLSLEAVDDRVTLMIRSPDGERRAVAWEIEQPLLARFATATPPDDVAERAHIARDEVASFCEEMVSAGVLVADEG